MDTWVLPAMLGLGLAAASGMRTFLPLLMLSAAVHFELFGITVGESMRWIGSTGALVALAIAAVVELGADLIPFVDNALSVIGNVTGPIAGVIAAWAAFSFWSHVSAGTTTYSTSTSSCDLLKASMFFLNHACW